MRTRYVLKVGLFGAAQVGFFCGVVYSLDFALYGLPVLVAVLVVALLAIWLGGRESFESAESAPTRPLPLWLSFGTATLSWIIIFFVFAIAVDNYVVMMLGLVAFVPLGLQSALLHRVLGLPPRRRRVDKDDGGSPPPRRALLDLRTRYYPNSAFVHLNVRDRSATWVDYSGVGQPADYAKRPE